MTTALKIQVRDPIAATLMFALALLLLGVGGLLILRALMQAEILPRFMMDAREYYTAAQAVVTMLVGQAFAGYSLLAFLVGRRHLQGPRY